MKISLVYFPEKEADIYVMLTTVVSLISCSHHYHDSFLGVGEDNAPIPTPYPRANSILCIYQLPTPPLTPISSEAPFKLMVTNFYCKKAFLREKQKRKSNIRVHVKRMM